MAGEANGLATVGPESVPAARVRILGGLWQRLMTTNREVTLPVEYRWLRQTGRLAAYDLAWRPGKPRRPHIFWDSDVAKWIEAAAYSLAAFPDAGLQRQVDALVDRIVSAQQSDGYLNPYFTVVEPEGRWRNLRDQHELYCAGHLAEAAVAYFEATGHRKLLDAVCRYMDLIGRRFGRGRGQRRGYPGHEEIELALVRLARVTGQRRYLDLARYFVDERGRLPHYFDAEARARKEKPRARGPAKHAYCQAHLPVREQTEVVGHAVRATYLYAGMTDVAVATGDRALLAASRRLWRHLVGKRLHVTGGIGATCANEGFTCDYDLPNEGAYLETCAAIGLVFWSRRLLDADRDGRYADVLERALYNGVLSGVSADGKRFFYGNPLAAHPGFDGNGRFVKEDYHYRRSEWFGCACCPTNVVRLVAAIPGYLYSVWGRQLAVHLYARSEARIEVGGFDVRLLQETDYPWGEKVRFRVEPDRPGTWTLALRVPAWCRKATFRVNGRPARPAVRRGYARLRRRWEPGDRVEVRFAMPVERVEAHPSVRQDAGRVALQRGPVVYCLEEADNGPGLNDIVLCERPGFRVVPGRLGPHEHVPFITAAAWRRAPAAGGQPLYRQYGHPRCACRVMAIPYFLWANRAPGEMLVWIRQAGAPPAASRSRARGTTLRRDVSAGSSRRAGGTHGGTVSLRALQPEPGNG